MEGALLGEDLAQLLFKVFKSGHEQEDEQGAARAAQSAVCKLEVKVCASACVCVCVRRVCMCMCGRKVFLACILQCLGTWHCAQGQHHSDQTVDWATHH